MSKKFKVTYSNGLMLDTIYTGKALEALRKKMGIEKEPFYKNYARDGKYIDRERITEAEIIDWNNVFTLKNYLKAKLWLFTCKGQSKTAYPKRGKGKKMYGWLFKHLEKFTPDPCEEWYTVTAHQKTNK